MSEFDYNQPWVSTKESPRLILKNASLVDVRNGETKPDTTIVISNGKFEALVSHYGEAATTDDNHKCVMVDLAGKFVCPGLIDNHVHVTGVPGSTAMKSLYDHEPSSIYLRAAYVLKTMLMRGWTCVRDCGGADAGLRDAVEQGLIPGPRLVIAGRALSQTGGHGDFRSAHDKQPQCCGNTPTLGRVCDGVPAVLEAARDELRRGADFLKIMCGGGMASATDPLHMIQFTPAEIQAITTTASYLDTYATAHAYTPQAIRHAVDNGVRGIEHGNFIDEETARYCVEKGVVFTPTLTAYNAFRHKPFNSVLDPSSKEKLEKIISSGSKSLEVLKKAGAKVCYGSDLLGGTHYQQNTGFYLLNEVFDAADVLRCATLNAAEPLRLKGKIGEIQTGFIADCLVLDTNPLEDIKALSTPEKSILSVIKDGRVVMSKLSGLKQDDLYCGLSN